MSKHKAQSINDVVEDYRARHVMAEQEAALFAQINAGITFKGWEEPACEFEHVGAICTRTVTHRASNCIEQRNVCQSGRASIEERALTNTCLDCGNAASTCWKVWAV